MLDVQSALSFGGSSAFAVDGRSPFTTPKLVHSYQNSRAAIYVAFIVGAVQAVGPGAQ